MRVLVLWLVFSPDVEALASVDYHVREAAEARLTRWADLVYPLINRPFADPEQRRRARRIASAAVPDTRPQIAVLAGKPLPEWTYLDGDKSTIGAKPGPQWHLSWLRPDKKSPLIIVVNYYGEKCRSQYVWRDWHRADDGTRATDMMVRDLLAAGVPPILVRGLLTRMSHYEETVSPDNDRTPQQTAE